jgi:hypothetical protein
MPSPRFPHRWRGRKNQQRASCLQSSITILLLESPFSNSFSASAVSHARTVDKSALIPSPCFERHCLCCGNCGLDGGFDAGSRCSRFFQIFKLSLLGHSFRKLCRQDLGSHEVQHLAPPRLTLHREKWEQPGAQSNCPSPVTSPPPPLLLIFAIQKCCQNSVLSRQLSPSAALINILPGVLESVVHLLSFILRADRRRGQGRSLWF